VSLASLSKRVRERIPAWLVRSALRQAGDDADCINPAGEGVSESCQNLALA